MNAHSLLSGEIIEYPNQPAAVSAFLARVRAAVNDPTISPATLLALVYGAENPLLDTTSQPGRAIVTKATFENPVYHVLADLVGRKQMLAAVQTEQHLAAFTVSVKDASRQIPLSESSVRTAIAQRKLSAMKINGEWYIRPESVASYRVSSRGRKKAQPPAGAERAAVPVELGPATVRVRCGGSSGGSLAVRIAGAALVVDKKEGEAVVGHFPTEWVRAAIRTTSSTGVRVFEIEPDARANETVKYLDLFVSGAFKVTKKHNATRAAGEVWKQYAEETAIGLEANESYRAGKEAGERWAMCNAQPSHLRRLEEKYNDDTLTGVPDAYGWGGVLYSLLTGDQHGDRVEIRGFWKGVLGEDCAEMIEDVTFAEGFVDGALEVGRRAVETVTPEISPQPVVSANRPYNSHS